MPYRPANRALKPILVYVEGDLRQALKIKAAQLGTTAAALIRQALAREVASTEGRAPHVGSSARPPVAARGRTLRRRLVPTRLRRFFWDSDAKTVSLDENRGYVIRRLVSTEDSAALTWLRSEFSDEEIAATITAVEARGLTYRQVAAWIPRWRYDQWAAAQPRSLWANR